MQAAFIERLGPPDVIRYSEVPAPVPGPADVLVDVAGTTVNPVDTFVRSGLFRTPMDFPFVISRDLVGTVAATGGDVRGFAVGERVWCNSLGHGGRQGAAAEQAVVPADRLYRLPDRVDPYAALATVHPAATAHLALFTHGRLRKGETVVVAGGAGNVGSALVAMAAWAGARVVATARPRDAEYCRRLGAAEVVDHRAEEEWELLGAAAPDGIDLYTDTSGRNDLERVVPLLAPRGRVVVLAGAASRPALPAGEMYMKDASIVGFVISRARVTELAEAADVINTLLADGLLRPRRTETLPLAAAAEAHRRMERGELNARRVILTPPGAGALR
ncbi:MULTISPECIES: NADPH:quinone reductase [Streptomyces]|uniref:Oxidoreductase n=2 Tax=Streptomyces chartreusis TaxID=1969 RepID=F8QZQ2_STRCX|nr:MULTISPECIES: NADPH:quinone reductase [Streptomyces]AEH42472.1 oxidoreductase [Streptomyces chartreusis NRRL 3882]MYS90464.1 zinc-binding dehydrogenase [Streptomyces sp. SID5464]SOR83544.1 Acrylyl-CoA reductase AcuI [Streptomyces chartreusis NRRL 3882]